MALQADVIDHIKRFEGFRKDAYKDPGSVNGLPITIGYGQTRRDGRLIKLGETITESEATAWLVKELARVEAVVDRLVTVDLSPYQLGALVSFVYNVGDGAFSKSTLLKKLNAGDYAAVPAQLARWNKNDGKVMAGLTNRRAAEAGMWAKGSFVASAPVEAKPGNAVSDLLKPENVTSAAGLIGGAAAVASGNGPVQYAIAALMVVAAITAAFLLIRKATR